MLQTRPVLKVDNVRLEHAKAGLPQFRYLKAQYWSFNCVRMCVTHTPPQKHTVTHTPLLTHTQWHIHPSSHTHSDTYTPPHTYAPPHTHSDTYSTCHKKLDFVHNTSQLASTVIGESLQNVLQCMCVWSAEWAGNVNLFPQAAFWSTETSIRERNKQTM